MGCCKGGGFKLLNTGRSLRAEPVVKSITSSGGSLVVTNTDNTTYEVGLPTGNLHNVNFLNASGTQVVATVATKD